MKKQLTLCLVCKDNQVLLGLKKKGFGVGRWNGFGGKVEVGESIEAATSRELKEEAGLMAKDIKKVGIIEFTFESDPKVLEVHLFKVTDYEGEPVESDEMRPQWFKYSDIPFAQMWSDDQYWMPYLLADKLFKGKFYFDRPSDADYQSKIISQELFEVNEI